MKGVLYMVVIVLTIFWCQFYYSLSADVVHCTSEVDQGCHLGNMTYVCVKKVPRDISDTAVNVVLNCLSYRNKREIKQGAFLTKNWGIVRSLHIVTKAIAQSVFEYIVLFNGAFHGLYQLEELRINEIHVIFLEEAFVGLDNVHSLTLLNGERVVPWQFLNTLKDSSVLRKLQRFVLTDMFSITGGFSVNETILEPVSIRPVTYLELSNMQLNKIDLIALAKYCNRLKYIAINGSVVNGWRAHTKHEKCKNLKILDLRGVQFPFKSTPFCFSNVTIRNYHNASIVFPMYSVFANADIYLCDSLCRNPTKYQLRMYNVTGIRISKRDNITFNVKELQLTNNAFIHIDAEIIWKDVHLEKANVSSNRIQYVNPKFLTGLNNTLSHIDLSNNELGKMDVSNPLQFEQLFTWLYKLTFVSLAKNGITGLPRTMFIRNTRIGEIDLSRNFLSQVHIELNELKQLKLLDISYNLIKTLDSISMSRINSAPLNTSFIIMINNPFSCWSCNDYYFINWCLTTSSLKASNLLKCAGSKGHQIQIDAEAREKLHALCERPRIVMLSTITPIVFLVFVSVISCSALKLYHRRRKRLAKEDRRKLIRNNEATYENVVFILTGDEGVRLAIDFKTELDARFHVLFGTNRDVVTTCNIEPGLSIFKELKRRIKEAAVVLILLSENDDLVSSGDIKLLYEGALREKPIEVLLYDTKLESLKASYRIYFNQHLRNMWMLNSEMSSTEKNRFWQKLVSAIEERFLDIPDFYANP